jgi:hypothetical protein
MSSVPIHTGQWTDWSHGTILGSYRTYDVRETSYIISGTSAFVTYVGGCVWLLCAFSIHQLLLANNPNGDLITLQHRSIYRNVSTAPAAATDAFWVFRAWKPWKLFHRRKKRANSVALRTCALMVPALAIFAAFAVASVFSSRIAIPAYKTSTVLISDGFSKNQCGIALFDGSVRSLPSFDIKAASDTHAAISYSRSCYSQASGIVNSVSCSFFATSKLNYTREEYVCPFNDPTQPFTQTICNVNDNNAAHRLTTALLDSHYDFGINAPSSDRVKLNKSLTCSPLSIDGFTSTEKGHGSEANSTVTDYNYGETGDYQGYTYQYNPAAAYDNVPFEVLYVDHQTPLGCRSFVILLTSASTLSHNATGRSQWTPVFNISRTDADVTIVFVAPNAIKYREPVIDPFFKAIYPTTELTVAEGNITVYNPYDQVNVMGCVEQYQICREEDYCTNLGGQEALGEEILSLGLNAAQFVTAQRMIYMINYANTYSSINGIGPDALKVWSQVYGFVAPGLPQNQWKIEVEGWFETTLAKWQAFMVEFAANTANLGPHGHVGFPVTNSTLDFVWRAQCQNQKVSNVGAYQNVSVFGFAFIWAVGGFLVVLSWSLKWCISMERDQREKRFKPDRSSKIQPTWRQQNPKSSARRIAWNIDGTLQQNRLALRSVGYNELKGGRDDVPYLDEMTDIPLQINEVEDTATGDTMYIRAEQETEAPDVLDNDGRSTSSRPTHVEETEISQQTSANSGENYDDSTTERPSPAPETGNQRLEHQPAAPPQLVASSDSVHSVSSSATSQPVAEEGHSTYAPVQQVSLPDSAST